MIFYADLHVHSRYSRATSKNCDLENLAYWARKKGIEVIATGDFTHPAWREELERKLVPAEPGLFRLRDDVEREVDRRLNAACRGITRFMLSVEISTIKKRAGKVRKVHHLVYAPDFASVDAMVARLVKANANLASDGRPMLGMDSRHLLEIVLESGPHTYLVPAHVWTPWFSALGSKSGFDRIADCYGDLADHIFAVETGLSSDPEMNWRVSHLDRYTLVSNSDAHSPAKLGREANLFTCERDYFAMRQALESGDGFAGTVEFFPEEGKYHLDGHRKCGVVFEPDTTREHSGRCPVCQQPLTIGVMHRVQELSDRPPGFRPEDASPFHSLVPLPEVIAEIVGTGSGSKTVAKNYEELLSRLGSEFFILEQAPVEDIERAGSPQLAEAVARMRAGQVIRKAGFDGEYGVIRLFEDRELAPTKTGRRQRPNAAGRGQPSLLPLLDLEPPAVAESEDAESAAKEVATAAPGQTSAPQEAAFVATAAVDEADTRRPGQSEEPGSETGRHTVPVTPRVHERPDEPMDDHLVELDSDQRAAAAITRGALLILAGPGTGKTRTLTRRIARLVTRLGVAPQSCLAITFTHRAADEMRDRLGMIAPDVGGRVPVMTFHGLALTILRENRQACGLHRGFRVATDDERAALLAKQLQVSPGKAKSLLRRISTAKHADDLPAKDSELARAMEAYRNALDLAGLLDFDDLLVLAVSLLESESAICSHYRARYQWISIDEYQDIDELQYRLVRLLCPPGGNLCAIGDPDQAIYGFRGADVRFFLRFRDEYPDAQTIQLTRNYRSTPIIVQASVQAVAPSSLVDDRRLIATRVGTHRIELFAEVSERAEAERVVHTIEQLVGGTSFFSLDSGRVEYGQENHAFDFSDFAVLYRTEAQTPPLIEAFARSGIPFQKRSHNKLLDHPGIAALARSLAVQQHPGQTPDMAGSGGKDPLGEAPDAVAPVEVPDAVAPVMVALRNAASELRDRGAADVSATVDTALELLRPMAERAGEDVQRFLSELALNAEIDTWDPRADRVSLLTLHAAKGLEFRVVFLVGCEDGIIPLRFGSAPRPQSSGQSANSPEAGSPEFSLAEERRLFFVGMTRARESLYLTRARRRAWRGKVRKLERTPFIDDIDGSFLTVHDTRAHKRKKNPKQQQLGLF